jgi:hypothetical protein
MPAVSIDMIEPNYDKSLNSVAGSYKQREELMEWMKNQLCSIPNLTPLIGIYSPVQPLEQVL